MLKLNIVNNLTATDIDSLEERAKEMNAQMMNDKMLENKKSFKMTTIAIVLLCMWSYLFANSLVSDEELLNFIYSGSTVLCLIILGLNIVSYFED